MMMSEKSYGVAIIGCGLIGKKRALSLTNARLVGCSDININSARELAKAYGGKDVIATTEAEVLLDNNDVDIAIVSTSNDVLAEITIKALLANKHVLVEKPGARNLAEMSDIMDCAQKQNCLVRVGFNHRYHPAMIKARRLIDDGHIGETMFVRGRYGHGGRVGYESEWRANQSISGGGELLDQGVHLIDLAHWFLGEFHYVSGYAGTYYWDMEVEDNGFLLLRTELNKVAFLHVSWTEWKNTFSFEIYGKQGKLSIDGLGGSYGVERLAYYKMLPEMGPPETTIWEYPMGDESWALEFKDFLEDIIATQNNCANLQDAKMALEIVQKVHLISRNDNHA